MASIARLALRLAAAAALPVVVALGCSVEQIGADGCKKIESERCAQVAPCKNIKITDVASCQRFYRDQCLHGLSLEAEPGGPVIDKCVSAIKTAGECAKAAPDAPCTGLAVAKVTTTACDVLEHPEYATDCAFLVPPVPAPAATAADAGTDAPTD
jgi:hypothetical protein